MTADYDVLALGIAAVDDLLHVPAYPPSNVKIPITRSARHPGGLACTAVAAAARLGGSCSYLARLGADDLSAFIKTSLAKENVDTSHILPDPAAEPFHATIIIDDAATRTIFYDCSRYRPLAAEDLPDSLITAARILFLDYLIDPPPLLLAEKIHNLNIPILADIEARSAACLPLLPLIDTLIVSEEFARWIAGANDLPTACAFLAKARRRATVVTAGAHGSYLATADSPTPLHIPAFKVETRDTNGCGDTFHGAFALALARNLSPRDAATFASAAAALKASGGSGWSTLPTASELRAFLTQRLPAKDLSPPLLECLHALTR